MASDHYFTSSPGSELRLRPLEVTLAGEPRALQTAGGIFNPDGIDAGTAILLDAVPAPPAVGDLLDVGCGWGPLTLTLALLSPDARVWAVDVNERALDLVRLNAERLGMANVTAALPHEVPADIRFAAIWSNPPIRVGKDTLHEILETWLPRLDDGADAHLVVAKHLGADSLQRWLGETLPGDFTVERTANTRGYRVIRVTR